MPTGALSASIRNRRSLIAVAACARWFWCTRFTKRAMTPSARTVEQAPIMIMPSTVDRSPTTAATGPINSATPMRTDRATWSGAVSSADSTRSSRVARRPASPNNAHANARMGSMTSEIWASR